MTQSLRRTELKSMVVGISFCLIKHRVGTIADIRSAEIGVPTRGSVELLGRHARHLVAVRRRLTINRVARRSDARLVKRDRNSSMDAVVADIGESEGQSVHRLPLQVETPVLGIGDLVSGIVSTEQEWVGPRNETICNYSPRLRVLARLCGIETLASYKGSDLRKVGWRGSGSRTSKRVCERIRCGAQSRNNEGRIERDTKRPIKTIAGARRQLCKELSTVIVQTEARADDEVLQEGR